MSKYQVTITIVRTYDDRTAAEIGSDSITSRVPEKWEIRRDSIDRV